MCTLTWRFGSDGYRLHFNRDESRKRRPATAPMRCGDDGRGASYLAPHDGEAGGTWMSVNARGVSLALLNAYQFMRDPRGKRPGSADGFRSRGLLVADLAGCESLERIEQLLDAQPIASYQPFSLYTFEPAGRARVFLWDGTRFEARGVEADEAPVCSSAFDHAEATRVRRALFEQLAPAAEGGDLDRFHSSHEPQRGAFSPCMHREDAHTVSYSRVVVGAEQVEFHYSPAAPCQGEAFSSVTLAREPAPSFTR